MTDKANGQGDAPIAELLEEWKSAIQKRDMLLELRSRLEALSEESLRISLGNVNDLLEEAERRVETLQAQLLQR